MASDLGVPQQTISRGLIALERQGRLERRPPEDSRRQALRAGNAAKTARVITALGEPGGCGSWTCRDAGCQVPSGRCHHCDQLAALAPQSDRRKRWVAGEPMLCCSDHGPMWLTLALRDGRTRGLRTCREAAQWFGVMDIGHYLRNNLLQPDQTGPGRLMWFSEATLKRCQSKVAREGSPQLDDRAAAEHYFDERWADRLVERYGAKATRRRRDDYWPASNGAVSSAYAITAAPAGRMSAIARSSKPARWS